MPWLSIILAILSFFASGGAKKENRTKALLTAGLVGAGTYYASHNTDWGSKNLGEFDGVASTTSTTPIVKADGTPVVDSSGAAIKGSTTGPWDVLKGWGAAGTAAVIGTTAAVATGSTKMLLFAAAAFGALLLLKD